MRQPGALLVITLVVLTAWGTVAGDAQPKTLGESPYRAYRQWTKVNDQPVFSATHGQSFVFTYVNPTGLPAAREGKFPFPIGTVIVKEAFQNDGCKPGAPGAIFVMEKRAAGYDTDAGDWHWARYNPDRTLWGEGDSRSRVDFCAGCHVAARVNDYVFGNGTKIKATPRMPLVPCAP